MGKTSKVVRSWLQSWFDRSRKDTKWEPKGEIEQTLAFVFETFYENLIDLPDRSASDLRLEMDRLLTDRPSTKAPEWRSVRLFFKGWRTEEVSYVRSSLHGFRSLVWSFVSQISSDLRASDTQSKRIEQLIEQFGDTLENGSLPDIRVQATQFMSAYREYVGTIQKQNDERRRIFSEQLKALRQELTQAREDLKVDPLTKAFNRKAFDQQVEKLSQLNELSGTNSILLMIDIDHFKKINDSHGHPFGDFVLKEMANLLFRTFPRKTDLVCRYGGEEFAVLLKDAEASSAPSVGERLITALRSCQLVHNGKPFGFTASVGVAVSRVGESPLEWVQRADAALYEAKRAGRDRYVLASEAPSNKSAA